MSTDREWVGRDKTETEKSATRWSRGKDRQTDRQTDRHSKQKDGERNENRGAESGKYAKTVPETQLQK